MMMWNYHPQIRNGNQYLRIAKVDRLFISEVQGITDGVHIAHDGGVEDAGIAFSHFDADVIEHFRLYDLQDCALLFTHLSDAIESLLNNQWIDFSPHLLEVCNNLMDRCVHTQ